MSNTFCPLYKEAADARPWNNSNTPNTGLLFDKFANAWTHDEKWEFDKEKPGNWLKKFAKPCGDKEQLDEACQRQRALVNALGGMFICLKNTSRFVTGMGRQHPLENGFTWHHTLGVPYLPGSSLKGLLRAWLREEKGQRNPEANKGNGAWEEDTKFAKWFGSQSAAGRFILLDMLPTAPPQLAVDVMTPHYGPYYQDKSGKTPPGDWHSPKPIQFLAVDADNAWQLGILPVPGQNSFGAEEIAELKTYLIEALDWLGAGAKTNVGYGRFERDSETEEKLRQEDEERRKEEEEVRKREEALAKLPPELAELQRRAGEEQWETDNSAMLNGLERYLTDTPEPTPECIDWIRARLEDKWPEIWANPDRTKGKKNKPFYKDRPRRIVHKLKRLAGRTHQT